MLIIEEIYLRFRNNTIAKKTPYFLTSIVFLGLLVRLLTFSSMFRFDSYFYAQLSYFISVVDLNSFFFENNDFFAIGRLLLFLPTGFLYRVFGVNDVSSVVFILLSSLLNIIAVYFLGKKLAGRGVGLLSALLLAIYPLDVYYSTQFLPDGLIPLFFTLSALTFLYGEGELNLRKRYLLYYFAGLFIGLSQYIRENAFVFFGVLVAYMIIRRKFRKEYLLIILGGGSVFVLAGIFFLIGTGDFFFQINQVIKQFSSSQERIFSSERVIDWLGFTKILLTSGLFKPFSLFFSVSLIYSMLYKRKELLFVLVWLFALIFYLEVISQFHGLGKHDRYLSIVTVPFLVLTSTFLISMYNHFKFKLNFVILFLIIFVIISITPVRIISRNLVTNKFFSTYRSLASKIKDEDVKAIYIENLKHKGYMFNYIFGFNSLKYNSFQRDRVSGTDSLLIDWDRNEVPKPGSYVVVDSRVLKKAVKPSWELITKKHKAFLYYVPLGLE